MASGCSQRATPQNAGATSEKTAQPDVRATILKETQQGGKYDFFTPIKGHESDGIQLKPGVYDTKRGLALYKWGKANYEAGIKSLDEVYALYSEYKKRPANELEKTYLKMGFNRELE
jgi:hypothetical protein